MATSAETATDSVNAPSPSLPSISWSDVAGVLLPKWRSLAAKSLAIGVVGLGISFIVPPTFTARTQFLPPQPQQSAGLAAMASMGALSGLVGSFAGLKTPADQYISLMQSVTVMDKIIDKFELMALYDEKYRVDTRKELSTNVRMSVGKKDGLITLEVDDHDPARAARMANAFVDELRTMASSMDLTEAQQKRAFFEKQLLKARDGLAKAQEALHATGFTEGVLRSEPKAAAESYARLQTELTAAEAKLMALGQSMTEAAPEVRQQRSVVATLRQQLSRLEAPGNAQRQPTYINAYRDYKYNELLVEMFAKQYEVAKVEESRDGVLIQVIDSATPPERKSKPKRSVVGILSTLGALVVLCAFELLTSKALRRRKN